MVCLFRIYWTVYRPTDPILDREVGGGHEITVGKRICLDKKQDILSWLTRLADHVETLHVKWIGPYQFPCKKWAISGDTANFVNCAVKSIYICWCSHHTIIWICPSICLFPGSVPHPFIVHFCAFIDRSYYNLLAISLCGWESERNPIGKALIIWLQKFMKQTSFATT